MSKYRDTQETEGRIMEDNTRQKPQALLVMEALNKRMTMSRKEKQSLYSMTKGYEGECTFDDMIKEANPNAQVMKDLLLKVNGTTFQIDTILISSDTIYFYEVKNYEGEYQLNKEKMIIYRSGTEILNPVNQLQRSSFLFSQLLNQNKYHFNVTANVIFINPQFTLYASSPIDNVILPPLVPKHLDHVASLKYTKKSSIDLIKFLRNQHISDHDFAELPKYSMDTLNQQSYCRICESPFLEVTGRKVRCEDCGKVETIPSLIKRQIEEFSLLFPDRRLTTPDIHQWCGKLISPFSVRHVLKKNYQSEHEGRWRYYR